MNEQQKSEEKLLVSVKNHRKPHTRDTTYLHLYSVWKTMLHRCENPKRTKYEIYGGRGITVCKEWHDVKIFVEWAVTHGYFWGLQIDRINNDEGYSPANCRFVTPKENSRNRRNTKYLTINGITKNVSEWCETINISEFTIYWWYKKFGREYAETRITKKESHRCMEQEGITHA